MLVGRFGTSLGALAAIDLLLLVAARLRRRAAVARLGAAFDAAVMCLLPSLCRRVDAAILIREFAV